MGNVFTPRSTGIRMASSFEAERATCIPFLNIPDDSDRNALLAQAADFSSKIHAVLSRQQVKSCSRALSRLRNVFPNKEKIFRQFFDLEHYESSRYDPSRTSVGRQPINISKNRYTDIVPFDDTRVVLKENQNSSKLHEETDYINANFIVNHANENLPTFIATQGPLPGTVEDFWRMMIQYRCPVIVMLTQLVDDHKTVKCADYFPMEEGCRIYGRISVTNKSLKISKKSIASRLLEVKNTESEEPPLPVLHLQYLDWPDHGVPSSSNSVREIIKRLYLVPPKLGPFVVHCSAGIGRTGAFCTIFHTLYRILEGDLSAVNLNETVHEFRNQRIGMVQNQDQFYFCYDAVVNELEDLISQPKKS
eukprot:TRINITY_DN18820_c0_g1_i1.p1 TRINITY_DN18820_c0_g1~~TRINITY_DN18820_c0_g1_i1.p1  ORF type:complete len:363 (-),score=56.10 TRINITY_DN18820_c0_g1_i1:267-1355(-)